MNVANYYEKLNLYYSVHEVASFKSPYYYVQITTNEIHGFIWNIKLKGRKLFTDKELNGRISYKRLQSIMAKHILTRDIKALMHEVFTQEGELQNFYRDVLEFIGGEGGKD